MARRETIDDSGDNGTPVHPPSPQRVAFGTVSGFVAFGMGSGLSPVAPGTAGSLAALPLAIPLMALPTWAFWTAWFAAYVIGNWCCDVTSRRLATDDPGGIVWDEMVAMWLILACVPAHWAWWLAAFVAFRVFDIFKPWPIRPLERRVAGGAGIMVDDLVAAAYALAVLLPARLLVGA